LVCKNIIKGRWPEAEQTLADYADSRIRNYWSEYVSFLEELGQDVDLWKTESW